MQLSYLLPLLPLAVSAPLSTPVKRAASPIVSSTPFTLTSKTLDGSTPFNALPVYPYHIDPTDNWAVLGAGGTTSPAPTAVINGTVDELATARGDLVFGFGADGSLPYSWIVSGQFGAGVPIQINAGEGTRGIYLHDDGREAGEELYVLEYDTPFFSGWYGKFCCSQLCDERFKANETSLQRDTRVRAGRPGFCQIQ